MKDLQEIINKKAEKRATSAVKMIIDAFNEDNAHGAVRDKEFAYVVTKNEKGEDVKESIRSAFWSISSKVPKYMIKELTKRYIPEESKRFVEEVKMLQMELDELKSIN